MKIQEIKLVYKALSAYSIDSYLKMSGAIHEFNRPMGPWQGRVYIYLYQSLDQRCLQYRL